MRVRIAPSALLLWAVLLWEGDALFPAALLAAAVHECGHLLAARRLGIRLRLLELDFMGAKLYPAHLIPSYGAEALLALAGPAFSLLFALLCLLFSTPFARLLCFSSLSFALFNLLPIEGFDGGRVLEALLCATVGERAGRRVQLAVTYACLLMLFCLSACLLLRYGEEPMLCLLSASLFARLFLACGTCAPPRGRPRTKKRGFGRI